MKFDTKYPWYILDLIVFTLLNVLLLWLLQEKIKSLQMNWMTFSVLGLAVYRGAHVISNEKITRPLREPLVDTRNEEGVIIEVPKKRGARGAFGNLLYCPSCTGIWVSMIVVYTYLLWPKPVQVIAIILALSGIERLLTALFDHWKNPQVYL